jgi:hypothetical protein
MADPSEHDTALEEQDTSEKKLAEVHKRAMKRFDDCAWPQRELRAESLAARRFVTIPGADWEDEWGEQFANSIKISVPKVGRGLRKIETDYRENRIVPDFRPDGGKADQDTANMLDGLHRADSYRFKSQQARDNAAFEAFAGGFGAYRLCNEWEDEADKDNDHQRINPAGLITDADQSVYFDPNARLYDKSDARFAFIRTAMTIDAYHSDFGDDLPVEFPDGAAWQMRDWFTPSTIAIAEYYEVEEVSDALWILTYTLSGEQKRLWSSELEDGQLAELVKDGWKKKRQNRKRRRVHKYVLSGERVLEDRGLIAGDCIPIVPIYGQRYFVENQERWKGYVQDKMDGQRGYNSMVSRLVETASLSPREIPVFAPEQMPPAIANQWARANIDRLPYLLAEPLYNEDGTIAQVGPVSKITPPQLAPVDAALIQIFDTALQEDMVDGADTVKANVSEDAMNVAATRIDAKSGIYLDNVRQSVQREGEIYLSMAREVYAEDGREVETMTEDGDDGVAVLKQAVTNGKTGVHSVVNDLQSGRYKVIASVTEATATRRDKTVKSMLATAQVAITAQDMELAQAALLTAVLNQEGEGIDDFHAWARKRALNIGLVEPNEEEQAAMEAASENAAPDPTAEALQAQADDFKASAAKKLAEIDETKASTRLKDAQAVETLAGIPAKQAQAMKTRAEVIRPAFGGSVDGNRVAG